MIWAAVVVQIHLLLVQDLHRHGADSLAADSQPTSVLGASSHTQVEAVRGQGTPLCPACQITRHGSIQVEPSNSAPFQPVEWGDVVPLPLIAFHPVSQLPPSGRAPPFFS